VVEYDYDDLIELDSYLGPVNYKVLDEPDLTMSLRQKNIDGSSELDGHLYVTVVQIDAIVHKQMMC
jgi:hypothetical protein